MDSLSDEIESILFVGQQVLGTSCSHLRLWGDTLTTVTKQQPTVYRLPPRTSNEGYKAADWNSSGGMLWKGRVRVVERGRACEIRLEDANTGENVKRECQANATYSFNLCLSSQTNIQVNCSPCAIIPRTTIRWNPFWIHHGTLSSELKAMEVKKHILGWVLKNEVMREYIDVCLVSLTTISLLFPRGRNKRSRYDAFLSRFDFNVALQSYSKHLSNPTGSSNENDELPTKPPAPVQDFSLKEGQTFSVKIPGRGARRSEAAGGGGNGTAEGSGQGAPSVLPGTGSGGIPLLAPPPGKKR